uniref:Reverse transcriptase domain-containing protein n=1 Tax=Tanacetum cinerariifolium TaxID=118510 RepID=A0A699GPU7_TANCI|nr:reverse transcriptase domain-containing protein [Tanacetum cinerariifolium]
MRTRSSSNLPVVSPNPSTSNPKRHNRRRSKQPFILEESPIDTMADQHTIVELLRAPTEGYAKAIVVPLILAEQFELKHILINMMTSDQFFGLEKDNPHDHIRWFNKITSTIKYKDVPNSAIKLMLFSFSLAGAARQWLEKEPSRSIHTWEDLAWDRYKDLLLACPHHGFTELHQVDTFYNALNPADQDSLNAAAGGNLLERRTQDVLTIIENTSKIAKLTHAVNQQTSTAMTAILKQFQETPPPAFVKAGNSVYRPPGMANQIRPSGFAQPNVQNNQNRLFQMNTASTSGSGSLPSNTVANPKGELKAITTRSGLVLDGPTVPTPPPFINPKEDERVEETLMDPDLSEYTIKVPPPPKLPEKLEDPGKFLISCGFKEVRFTRAISTHMTLELANRAICTLARIARDVFVPVGKFTFPADFVIVDYESDPIFPLILGRPFLRIARALIDVYGDEMILRDGDERLTLNMRHETSSYSNQPQIESINLINVFNNSSEDFLEDLFSNQTSGNPTFPSHPELTSPEVKNDIFDSEEGNVLPKKLLDLDSTKDLHPPLHFDVDSDLKEIEFLVYQDIDSSLKDSIDQKVESDTENVYDDPFDSKGDKIKESKLLIDELDLPCDSLPSSEYDSSPSEDFSRVDVKPSTNNEDKLFNLVQVWGNWVKLSDLKQALRGRHPMLILSF